MDILTLLVPIAVLLASIVTITIGVDKFTIKIRRWKRQRAAKKRQAAPTRKLVREMVQRPSDEPPNSRPSPFPEP